MQNMSYCRFHNTRLALQECVDALATGSELSPDEAASAESMISLCETFTTLMEERIHEQESEHHDNESN